MWLWHGYRSDDHDGAGVELATPEQWFAFLGLELDRGSEIRTEYGDTRSLNEFRDFVIRKRTAQLRNSDVGPEARCLPVDGDDIAFYEFS